eukprot:6940856-Lingulodinium_polyedra.AAC.1
MVGGLLARRAWKPRILSCISWIATIQGSRRGPNSSPSPGLGRYAETRTRLPRSSNANRPWCSGPRARWVHLVPSRKRARLFSPRG